MLRFNCPIQSSISLCLEAGLLDRTKGILLNSQNPKWPTVNAIIFVALLELDLMITIIYYCKYEFPD